MLGLHTQVQDIPNTSVAMNFRLFQAIIEGLAGTIAPPVEIDPASGDVIIHRNSDQQDPTMAYTSFLLDDSRQVEDNSESQVSEYKSERFARHSIHQDFISSTSKIAEHKSDLLPEEKHRMIAIIRDSYFEPGVFCEADNYFQELVRKYHSFINPLSALSDITNHNIDQEHILEGVLHIISNCEYDQINPFGISIALAATVNHSPVVQDLLISCFESWDSPDGIDILEKLELEPQWLRKYRDDVVIELKCNEQVS